MSSRFVILTQCSTHWSVLTCDGHKHFCRACQTQIHGIELYSDEEIDRLRLESPGPLCGYVAGESLSLPRSRRAVLAGALLTAISPLFAQSGRVRIRVTDASGGAIAGAEGAVLDKDGNPIVTGIANESGDIVLTGLPIGDSRITVTKMGFKNLPLTVTIRNSDETKIDATLEVGPVTMGIILPTKKKRKRRWIFG